LKRLLGVADVPSGVVTIGAVVEISHTRTPPLHLAYKYSQLEAGHDTAGVSISLGVRKKLGAAAYTYLFVARSRNNIGDTVPMMLAPSLQ